MSERTVSIPQKAASSSLKLKNSVMDSGFRLACWSAAILLFVTLMMLILFVGKTGLLVFQFVTPLEFFFSLKWVPEEELFGAGSLILGTFMLTGLSLVISVPISLAMAAFNAVICPPRLRKYTRPILDTLVGIPSVVYGYIGLTVLIPLIRQLTGELMGDGLLVAAIVLAFMVLPTIARISDDAISALPSDYMEAGYALGATKTRMIWTILMPAARNGIITAIVLGMARALGETMAVVMVIGNVAQMPNGLFTPTAVLTSNIVSQIMNVPFDSTWNYALYMMAFLLLLISLVLILMINWLRREDAH
jgi:phosphate transport system permease protein